MATGEFDARGASRFMLQKPRRPDRPLGLYTDLRFSEILEINYRFAKVTNYFSLFKKVKIY